MRYFITLALASLLIIATAVPSEAKVVAIHAIAPLRGHGERSIPECHAGGGAVCTQRRARHGVSLGYA